jgi:hypothetical protein
MLVLRIALLLGVGGDLLWWWGGSDWIFLIGNLESSKIGWCIYVGHCMGIVTHVKCIAEFELASFNFNCTLQFYSIVLLSMLALDLCILMQLKLTWLNSKYRDISFFPWQRTDMILVILKIYSVYYKLWFCFFSYVIFAIYLDIAYI